MPKCATVWQKVKAEVNKHGPEKTVTQHNNKIRNLKVAYKATKENNIKSGASPKFCHYFNDFDGVLGTRNQCASHCRGWSRDRGSTF